MQFAEILCVVMLFALGMFLTAGGYILQRDRYWRRVWERLGEPDVKSIEELKALSKMDKASKPEHIEHEPAELVSNL